MTIAEGVWLPSAEVSGAILAEFGLRTPREVTVSSPEAVLAEAASFDGPLVLKAIAPDLVHKSDVGGVVLGITDPVSARDEAVAMASRIPELTDFLLQEQIEGSPELVIGMRRDPMLGAFVLVGLGGVWVEVLDDVAINPIPCTAARIETLLKNLRGSPLLDGARGTRPVDRRIIAQAVVAVSEIAMAHPEIDEIDLNPVVVHRGHVVALDRHMVCRSPAEAAAGRFVPDPTRLSQNISKLLHPNGIVVVGASADTSKVGGRLFRYLISHGYEKAIHAINPKAEPVLGHRAYRSVWDLPTTPDLACVVVPVSSVVDCVRECAQAGIRAITVYSSGFAETGTKGILLQERLCDIAAEYGVSIAGPNTAGIINTHASMCAAITMASEDERMPAGNIGVITQSGGLGSAMVSRLWDKGAGISAWVSCGNEANVSMSDYLEHLVEDPNTDVVVLFIEALREIERFSAACHRARELAKPVLAFKTGTTEIGRAAVHSHTAALAGDDVLYEAFFDALGIVRCHDLQMLLDTAVAMSWQPRPKGTRVAVISTSGGACSLAADACIKAGLTLPEFSDETLTAIGDVIPVFGSRANPVDVTLGASTHPHIVGDVVAAVMDEPDIDAILVVLTSNTRKPALAMAEHLAELNARMPQKPLVVARIAADYLAVDAMAHYRSKHVPVYSTPERAVAVLAAMARSNSGDVFDTAEPHAESR